MAGRRRLCAGALGIALALGPVGSSRADEAAFQPVALTVMTFNIWYGATGTHGLDQVVEAIREAHADVVGMQEPYARLRRIARELGFHASPRLHVISRFPILEPQGSNGTWAYLLLASGEVAAIANTHLSCCPYTPYRIVNRGYDRAAALRQERHTRLRQIRGHLSAIAPLLSAGVPTFFTGDFNAPSYRDWTPAAVEARGLPYTVRWPVSVAMEEVGFRDSYREMYPDPVADPGFTWTPGYPSPSLYPWEVFDRIDFVWAFGPAQTTASRIIGESLANADLAIRPYPSDHRAVASSFTVTPVPAPPFVVAEGESARLGLPLRARFHAEGRTGEHVTLTASGSTITLADLPTGGDPDGTVVFDTTRLAQGSYDVTLLDATDTEVSRDTVVLIAAGQHPVLTVADRTLEGDQRLEVAWAFTPGNQFDWLGVFRAGVSAKDGPIEAWRYTNAQIDGSTTIGPGARGRTWPLPPGRYEVRLCLDDSYRCRASTPFRVLG